MWAAMRMHNRPATRDRRVGRFGVTRLYMVRIPPTLTPASLTLCPGMRICHGPGEAHVAAEGGTDNIEGLGIKVERVEHGSLPRFELKAKRVKDDRVVKGEK